MRALYSHSKWDGSDFRFTFKGNKVFAFMLCVPENRVAILKSFMSEKLKFVKLLGGENLNFSQEFGLLTVKIPETLPIEYTNCLEIELA